MLVPDKLISWLGSPKLWQALCTTGLLLFVLSKVESQYIVQALMALPPSIIVVTFLFLSLNLCLVTFRLQRLLRGLGVHLPHAVVGQASILGHLASLFFISLFGQVAGRHAILNQWGVSSVLLASLTIYERFCLLLSSGTLCFLGAFFIIGGQRISTFIQQTAIVEIICVSACILVIHLVFFQSKFETQFLRKLLSKTNFSHLFEIICMTLVSQFFILLVFVVSIHSMHPDIPIIQLFASAAVVSFSASLPITVNGWGVREFSSVYIFGLLGVPSVDALAISIFIGLSSTLVILITAPWALKKKYIPTVTLKTLPLPEKVLNIEKISVWVLGVGSAVFIFFQIHVPIVGQPTNLNLADPFAILALAIVVILGLYQKRLPTWRLVQMNQILLLVSVLLLFGFCNGMSQIGVTQWALANRIAGWSLLLGYLSIGYLTMCYLGQRGIRRLLETMLITAATIVAVQIISRCLQYHYALDFLHFPMNFEGYAQNRNAFALQMILCSIFCIAYHSLYQKGSLKGAKVSYLLCFFHSLLLVGLFLTSSRTGMLTMLVLLGLACVKRWITIKSLLITCASAGLIWGLLQMSLYLPSQDPQAYAFMQSNFSTLSSDHQRWKSMEKGLELFIHNPILGAGLGVFIEKSLQWFQGPLVIHSTPIWILAEFGLLGFCCFAWIFFKIIQFLRRESWQLPVNRILVLWLITFLCFGAVHEIFYQRIFWLVLGCILASTRQPVGLAMSPHKRTVDTPIYSHIKSIGS